MTGGQCATCREPLLVGDQFCGNCGSPVDVRANAIVPQAEAFRPRGGTARKVMLGVVAFIVVAGVSGLVVAFIDSRRDLEAEREKSAAAQAALVEMSNTINSGADADAALQTQLAAAQAELVTAQATLAEAQTDLQVERDGRAADATAAETQSAAAVAAVQAQLDAVQAQLDSLQAVFPLDENAFRGAALTGEFAVTIQPVECTIVDCLELTSLSLSFPDPTKVSGNRANGVLSFTDGSYTATGALAEEQAPLCSGSATDATFVLTFHASRVAFAEGLLGATQAIGTYRETIDGGVCAGQYRSYSVSMVKQ